MEKILIAEDDSVLLNHLITVLGKHRDKFGIIGVGNGKEAIEALKKEPVSLLITDIKMPEVDGLALLAYMNENYPAIPCFVMTAYDTPGLLKELAKDIIRFLKKPFSAEMLGVAIIETLEENVPRGFVQGISVISFLHIIAMENKTCIFEVILPDKKGLFFFEKGILCGAVCEDMTGEEAALQLITNEKANFRFRHFDEIENKHHVLMDLACLTREALKSKPVKAGRA